MTDISDEMISKIAENTKNFTGSDIESMVNESLYAMREKKLGKLTDEILLESFETMNSGINLEVNF